MAIGNLFLGTARKTIGDIVMYRRNGEQLSRVRVRKIANPRTEAQALQRNYMAPVTKFYAPLADVLERSWEGLDRQKSLGAFLKTNAELARSRGWYVVKGAGFTPLPYKVSNGTLPPLTYSDSQLSLGGASIADIKVSTISAALVDMGYQYGDQLTTIICLQNAEGDVRPVWSRVILSSSDESDIFSDIAGAVLFEQGENGLAYSGVLESIVGAVFIVSRWNGSKWLRSSQYVQVTSIYLDKFTSIEARAAAIASYQNGDSVVSSDIYLNGGTGTKAKASELIVEIRRRESAVRVRYAIMLDVVQHEAAKQILISCRDAASGEVFNAVVARTTTTTQDGYVLEVYAGHDRFRNSTWIVEFGIKYTSGTANPAIRQWMQKHGVTMPV